MTQSDVAKDYLIRQILMEAEQEGVLLSDIEQQMLYYSETANTPSNLVELNEEFDRDYDQAQYEAKIARLIRNRVTSIRTDGGTELDQWNRAVLALSKEDHYLLVMITAAGASRPGVSIGGVSARPNHDRMKLIITAATIVVLMLALMFFLQRLGFDLTHPR